MLRYLFLITALTALPVLGQACTDFLIKSQDNARIVGRSLEFGAILPTQVQTFPKGQLTQSKSPNDQKGIAWTNKYSFIAMVLRPTNIVMDGFNEQGLSFGALWMPGTKYPNPPASTENALFFADLGPWILGNFASVEEATEALSKIEVFAASIPGFPEIPPIHLSLHDASGKSAVVEFLQGKMFIFDNPVGILTNAPEFSWHLTNLRNYINLTSINSAPLKIDGTVLQPTGQGTGLMGIPGDWTPPSRFVRTAIFKQIIATPKDAQGATLAAIHLLNTVDIPYGAIKATKNSDFDFTQWVVVKDLTNKKLYFRTYENQNVQMIDLASNAETQKTYDLKTSP